MEPVLKPLRLAPQYRDYVWGGDRLKPGSSPVAEAWVVYENNLVLDGDYANQTLAQVTVQAGVQLLGKKTFQKTGSQFPLLIKLLDCQKWISLQVHPDDQNVLELEGQGQFGKTESWYFIEAQPGAEILGGIKTGVARKEMEEAIRSHTLLEKMNRLKVQSGEAILIPAGMVHALGPGLLVYEVQQSSDWTYRVWDWDRPATSNRPLHIEKAIKAANPSLAGHIVSLPEENRRPVNRLVSCPYFSLSMIETESQVIQMDTLSESFHAITVIEGTITLEGDGWQQNMEKFETVVVPADTGCYRLIPLRNAKILCSMAGE